MRIGTILPAALALLIAITISAAAEEPTDKKDTAYSLGDAGELHLILPAGWTGASDRHEPPTIQLKASAGKLVRVQITPVPGNAGDADLKRAAELIGAGLADGSKEKKTTLEEIKGPNAHGYMSSYTDASANPGKYPYVTAGILASHDQALAVTLLYEDKLSGNHAAAVEALKTFSISPPAGGGATTATIASPDEHWLVSIPGKWQSVERSKSDDGKSRAMSAVSDDGAITLSVFLEPEAKAKKDSAAARDFYLGRMKRNPIPMENLKSAVAGEVATLEYDQGPGRSKRHNLNAYLAHEGIWVDVHISKDDWNESTDEPVFVAILKGLKPEAAK